MTNTKLLDKLKALTKNADTVNKEHIKQLRKVLRKLKKRQIELAGNLSSVDSDRDHQKIKQDINVLQMQRQKGIEVYKRLKKARREKGKKR